MRFDPFRELDRITERALASGVRAMPAEAFRRGDEFFVLLDVPGAASEDIQVTVERNVVSVQAQLASPRRDTDEAIIDERPHGRVSRQFFLGDNLEAGQLRADYDRGVLTLTVPVAEQSKPRQIEVGSTPPRSISIGEGDSRESPAQQGAEEGNRQPVSA
jgi:HSP20 family protein